MLVERPFGSGKVFISYRISQPSRSPTYFLDLHKSLCMRHSSRIHIKKIYVAHKTKDEWSMTYTEALVSETEEKKSKANKVLIHEIQLFLNPSLCPSIERCFLPSSKLQ
jgi:hypothetical protein